MSSSSRSGSDQDRHRGSDEFAATSILRVNGASHRSGDGYAKPKWIASPESSESEAGCRCIYQDEHEAKGHTSPAPTNTKEQLVLRTSERHGNEGERGRGAETKPRAPSRNRRTKTERTDEIERGSSVRFGIPDEIDSHNDFSSDASTITNSHYGDSLKNRNARVDNERNSQPKVEQIDACDSALLTHTDAAAINQQANQKAKMRGSTVTIMAVGNAGVRVNRAASSTRSETENRNGKSEPTADEANCVRARSASRTPHGADTLARSTRAEANENQIQSRPGTANRSRSANVNLARGRRQQSLDIQPETSIPWQLQMQTTNSEPQFPFSTGSLAGMRDAPASLTSSVLSVGSSASSASVVLEVKKMTLERRSFDERFGFTVFRQKGHLVVASVDANSEAWLQGLRVGDRILKLNRLQAKEAGFVDAVQTIASSLRLSLYVASRRMPEFSARMQTTPKLELDPGDDQRENYFKCVLSSSSGYFGFALAKKRSAPTQIFIAVIDIPSPAHSAGLRENDTLVQVNGIDITTMDYTKLISILRTSPSVALLVKRE